MTTDRVVLEAKPNTLTGKDSKVYLVVGGVETEISHMCQGFTLHTDVGGLNKCDLKMIPVEVTGT